MRKTMTCWLLAVMAVSMLVACDKVNRTKDPLEVETEAYLELIKQKKWDEAYARYTDETRKYWTKEEFVKSEEERVTPYLGDILIKRIEKHKLDATIFTEFISRNRHLNSLEEAKIKLQYKYENGKWWLDRPDLVQKGKDKERQEQERKDRVEKYGKPLKIEEFKVRTEMMDEGPTFVFSGKITNTGTETAEMVMIMVEFFNDKKEKIYSVVVVPIYISPPEGKEALKPKQTQKYQISILSEIGDDWDGSINYYVYDAGPMPTAQ